MHTVSSLFRTRVGAEPSGKTAIRGEAICTAEELARYAGRRRQPTELRVAERYLARGAFYGVRGDLAFCQALYETRSLAAGRVVPLGEFRPTDLWGIPGREDLDADAFIERHLQLLYGFAANGPLPDGSEPAAPQLAELEKKEWRGCAPHWEDLNGKWSYPGHHYGQDVVAIWRSLAEWAEKERRLAERRG